MPFVLVPPDPDAGRALAAATAALELGLNPLAYRSAWRAAALAEGVERGAEGDSVAAYAFSPRSTRGATRA